MSTTFLPFSSAAAVSPASADVADVRLVACAAIFGVTDSADGLP